MQTILTGQIDEKPVVGKPLGRHLQHDEASRSYRVTRHPAPLESRKWKRHGRIFTQQEGSCTCQALVGALMTEPLYTPEIILDESHAIELYRQATRLDTIPGAYPPDDTGSTGLAAAKAAKREGYISGYTHAFGLADTLHALQRGPILLGITWYDSFDIPRGPDAELVIAANAEERGGHEVEINEIDVACEMVRGPNSWSDDYGDEGYFTISWKTLAVLLKNGGDVIQLRRD